ncbi:MAG TPA: transglycosylase domain-containing protein, partial [Pseudomonadales bacterium]|nr:transglycosylase domain-containing protein [Pseudomonadales bacterium]
MLGALLSLATITAVISGFTLYLGPQIPKIDSVLDLKLQTPLKIFSRDGLLIGEFGEMRREPLPYSALPPLYIKAVLAAEDDRFFTHSGVDPTGLARAAAELAKTGHIRSGGSTITMQLARNFFLSSEKSFIRKFNEILLSIQLERTLKKEKIFELYVNKIYLGHKAYGAQSAAYVYYGKTLDQLSLAQWAMLAGLPKAPSKYNPLVNPERALIRRNWILGRMLSLGSIDKKTYDQALIEPETASYHGLKTDVDSPYIAEMARQFAVEKLGSDAYNNGYIVRTTIDSHLQLSAQQAIWNGAVEYDQRHGYRGAEKHFPAPPLPNQQIASYWTIVLRDFVKIGDLEPAIIASIGKSSITLVLSNHAPVTINWSAAEAKRLQPYKSENYVAPAPKSFSQIFQVGDVIRIRHTSNDAWIIGQIPRIQAALVSIDSQTGAVIAVVGGTDFAYSKFNRATQALRQPGSSFKPFIYLKALENGYTPASLVNDAPIVFQEAGMSKPWRPENHGGTYLGPIPLRQALYQSRNMVAIRLLQSIGVKT